MILSSSIKKLVTLTLGLIVVLAGVVTLGFYTSRASTPGPITQNEDLPVFASGWQPQVLFDRAYEKASTVDEAQAESLLVAHHLLVADKIAETFLLAAGSDGRTIVIVGPNHFSAGLSAAQTTVGIWETPYGPVHTDQTAIQTLLQGSNSLQSESLAFENEHSVAALTPFIAKTFPHSKIVPIIVHEKLSAEDAWALGELIAKTLPDALLVASVDMVHGQEPDYTAEHDAEIIKQLEYAGYCGDKFCTDTLPIDSNSSLRVLAAFNTERGANAWHLTHHGSSMGMGAAATSADNVSHILGYYSH